MRVQDEDILLLTDNCIHSLSPLPPSSPLPPPTSKLGIKHSHLNVVLGLMISAILPQDNVLFPKHNQIKSKFIGRVHRFEDDITGEVKCLSF